MTYVPPKKATPYTARNFMPADETQSILEWCADNRWMMERGGDEDGVDRWNYEIINVDQTIPEMIAPFRSRLMRRVEAAAKRTGAGDVNVEFIETHLTLHHRGSFFVWHDDLPGYDGELVPSRRLSYCWYFHTDPKFFDGGELEFWCGRRVPPDHNTLVMFDPRWKHKVNTVDCYSRHALHGRWALMGWIHGPKPEGHALPDYHRAPRSG